MLPPPAQGLLPAGWLAFAGRGSNSPDRDERFQSVLTSSSFPGLTLSQVGPTPQDVSWQHRREGAFGMEAFTVDWENQRVRCPAGQHSMSWSEYQDKARGHRIKDPGKDSIQKFTHARRPGAAIESGSAARRGAARAVD